MTVREAGTGRTSGRTIAILPRTRRASFWRPLSLIWAAMVLAAALAAAWLVWSERVPPATSPASPPAAAPAHAAQPPVPQAPATSPGDHPGAPRPGNNAPWPGPARTGAWRLGPAGQPPAPSTAGPAPQ